MDLKWFHEMSWSDWDFFAEKDSTTLKDSTKDSTKFFAEKDTIPVLWWARMGGRRAWRCRLRGSSRRWQRRVGRMTVRVDLGVCTKAAAAVLLKCYETLVRAAVVHKHLVHLRRDVRPARPARAPTHPSPLASCCQCGGAGPDQSGAPGVQVAHLYDGDSGECLVSRPAGTAHAQPRVSRT